MTLHPEHRGEAATLLACPEQAKRVEWEGSLTGSLSTLVGLCAQNFVGEVPHRLRGSGDRFDISAS